MSPEELKLEVLKVAARADLCGGDADRAAEIARKFWEFLRPATPASEGPEPS